MKLCWALLWLLPAPLAAGSVCAEDGRQRVQHKPRVVATGEARFGACSGVALRRGCSMLQP